MNRTIAIATFLLCFSVFSCATNKKSSDNATKKEAIQNVADANKSENKTDSVNNNIRIGEVENTGEAGDPNKALGMVRIKDKDNNEYEFVYLKKKMSLDSANYINKKVRIKWEYWADSTLDEANTLNMIKDIDIIK